MRLTLNDSDARTVLSALREAYDVYERCAKDTEGTPRVADQFRRQMADCTRIVEAVESGME